MADAPRNEMQERLVKLHREGEERAAQRLAEKLNLPYADLSKMPVSLDAIRMISEDDARDGKVAAIEIKGNDIAVIAANAELPATKKVIHDLEAKKYIQRCLSFLLRAWLPPSIFINL